MKPENNENEAARFMDKDDLKNLGFSDAYKPEAGIIPESPEDQVVYAKFIISGLMDANAELAAKVNTLLDAIEYLKKENASLKKELETEDDKPK